MTTVWRCEPRSHGRNKAAFPLPGRLPSVAVPHRSASPALCPRGHAASFRRRASSFVRGVWSRRRCYLRRREAGGRGACDTQCGARARAAVLWLRLSLRRRVLRLSRYLACVQCDVCAWRLRARARWVQRRGGSACFSCKQGVASRREQRSRAPLVPVLEMPLMSPQAAVAVAAAESPLC